MSTFHPFPRLPFELRARIWKMTVEPRTVEVRVIHTSTRIPVPLPKKLKCKHNLRWRYMYVTRMYSPTPVPGPLQACHEARNLGLYQQAFAGVGTEPRYVWLNLEIDMVSIGNIHFKDFEAVAPSIKRLRFERENNKSFAYWGSREFGTMMFENVKEVHVICTRGLRDWHGASRDYYWACGPENVLCIDPDVGKMVTSVEMDAMFDRMLEEGWVSEEPGYEF